jgi:hypothetical protein
VFGKDVTITDNKRDVLRDPDSHGASIVGHFVVPKARMERKRMVCAAFGVDSHHQREHRGTPS